ncbi:P-type ATPase, A domain superfamily [Sesbania bispinosa]|nr:P-type ATPase, A domain superfamily [Sesbania bispinosa]
MKVPMEEKPFPAWSWSVEQCLKEYGVRLDKGLSTYEILLVAAFISFLLAYFHGSESGESGFEAYVEPLVIILILVLNAIVGVWQENNAEKALEALKELQCESGKVLRDGIFVPDLPARELVPGDIVELHVGDKVPADMRVAALKTSTLRIEQSSLTGEAMPVLKGINPIFLDDCELQAKENMVFAGTTVVNGSCLCIVITTGMNTEIGKIQKQIHEASLEDSDTPLKKKLDEFEGLPAVITTCLALGTRKMAQKNAIVRKLPSVETLGCTTVICSDKTGTLTTNQMSVTEFFTLGGKTTAYRVISVEGTTYDPKDGGIVDWTCYNMDANLVAMAEICAVCNDAGMGVPDVKSRNKIRDAQVAANNMMDCNTVKLGCCEWWNKRSKRVATLEFDRIRKSMSVIVREPDGENRLLVKGAVESLLERSSHVQLADGSLVPIDDQCRELLLQRLQEMSSKGLRCLGLAYKDDLGEFSDYYADTHPAHKKLLDPTCYSSIEREIKLFSRDEDLTGKSLTAVAEGRSIYNNMKAFIRYMISSNVGEVISIFLTAALGIPECMIPSTTSVGEFGY